MTRRTKGSRRANRSPRCVPAQVTDWLSHHVRAVRRRLCGLASVERAGHVAGSHTCWNRTKSDSGCGFRRGRSSRRAGWHMLSAGRRRPTESTAVAGAHQRSPATRHEPLAADHPRPADTVPARQGSQHCFGRLPHSRQRVGVQRPARYEAEPTTRRLECRRARTRRGGQESRERHLRRPGDRGRGPRSSLGDCSDRRAHGGCWRQPGQTSKSALA